MIRNLPPTSRASRKKFSSRIKIDEKNRIDFLKFKKKFNSVISKPKSENKLNEIKM